MNGVLLGNKTNNFLYIKLFSFIVVFLFYTSLTAQIQPIKNKEVLPPKSFSIANYSELSIGYDRAPRTYMNLHNSFGLQNYSFIGLGIGFDAFIAPGEPIKSNRLKYAFIPVYLDARMNFSREKYFPYVMLQAGYGIMVKKHFKENDGGILLSAGIGYKFKISEVLFFNTCIAAKMQHYLYPEYDLWGIKHIKLGHFDVVMLKLGIVYEKKL